MAPWGVTRDAPTTVLDAVNLLDAEGYGAQFILRDDGIRCTACGSPHSSDRAEVLRVYRFEGPSDPDEEAIVYGLRCPVCGAGGTLVSGFGPGADPALADHLVMLDARFRSNPTG
jgi:hypothetical protein